MSYTSRINCHANNRSTLSSRIHDGQARAWSCPLPHLLTPSLIVRITTIRSKVARFLLRQLRAGLSTRIRACHSRTLSLSHTHTRKDAARQTTTDEVSRDTAGRPLTSRGLGGATLRRRARARKMARGVGMNIRSPRFAIPPTSAPPCTARRSRRSFSSRSQQVADRARDREEE